MLPGVYTLKAEDVTFTELAPWAVIAKLPFAVIALPVIDKFPVVILPLALTTEPNKLDPVTVPVVLRLVPVAAPILGVVNCADGLTTILPSISNAVVLLSTLAENTVPANAKPACVLAM